jgi:hypothetical protein
MCWLLEWARALILDSLNHMISTASSPPQGSELLGGIWKPLPPETAFWYVLAASLSHVTSAAPPPHKEMNCWVRPKSSESRLYITRISQSPPFHRDGFCKHWEQHAEWPGLSFLPQPVQNSVFCLLPFPTLWHMWGSPWGLINNCHWHTNYCVGVSVEQMETSLSHSL